MAELYPYPRFSLAERDARWKRVRAKMQEENLDVIVAPNNTGHSTDFQANSRYLSHVGGGGDADIAVEQHPAYLHAEAKYDIAALNLSYARVNAPTSGILTHVSVEPGEYVEAGEILLAIVGTEDLWVEANLKEVDLEHLKVGQSATVILDSLPDVEWQATVDSISQKL